MAKYQVTNSGGVKDTERNMFIPPDSDNTNWQEYVIWLSQGNIPDPVSNMATQYPVLYANLTFSDGDGLDPPGINLDGTTTARYLTINGDIRTDPSNAATIIAAFTNLFRVTVRKIVSENDDDAVDSSSIVVGFTDGIISAINEDPLCRYTTSIPGIYEINHEDFALIEFYGTTYKIELVNNPNLFKVYP